MRWLYAGVACLLAGCATAYKPDGLSGGFDDVQLDSNMFRVSFRGNGYTKPERAEEFALLRSAELALSKGFSHFVIIDSQSREKTSTYTTPTQSITTANATAYGRTVYGSATTTTYGGQTYTRSKPSTTNTILCFKEKPSTGGITYDAAQICSSIGSKYSVTCTKSSDEQRISAMQAPLTTAPPPATTTTADKGTEKTNQKLSLDLPQFWKERAISDSLASAGVIFYGTNTSTDSAVILSTINKANISDLMTLAKSRRSSQIDKLTDAKASDIVSLEIKGRPALRFDVAGATKSGFKVRYLITLVDRDQEIAMINAWTSFSNFDDQKDSLALLASTLKP